MPQLSGKTIAVLATDGVELIELTEPVKALRAEGAKVQVVSNEAGSIQAFNHLTPADRIEIDVTLSQADASAYDGLLLPGGVANPDLLRVNQKALSFIRDFFDAAKPVAAICHAPWLLIEAGVAEGRTLTGFESIHTDLLNAGAQVENQEVVVDGNLITSRCPDDIPAFNKAFISALAGDKDA